MHFHFNAPLALGVSSHGEGSILGIFTARTTRFYLAVSGSENGLNDRTSKLGVRSFSWFPAARWRSFLRRAIGNPEHGGDGVVSADVQPYVRLPLIHAVGRHTGGMPTPL